MAHFTTAALAHFETHNGIASIDRLVELGMTREAIKSLQREGILEQVLQGAYRLRGQSFGETHRLTSVCVAHPGHVIAGPSAGRLFEYRRLPSDMRVHTISPPRSHPTRAVWVKPYRTVAIHPADIVVRPDGIVHTSRPRTALDLARFIMNDVDLLSVVEQAMHDGRHSAEQMYGVAVDWVSPRRPWVGRYLRLLERRLDGGPADSHPEVLLGDALVRAGLSGLVRQFRIDLPGHGPARFDLAFPRLRWAIEVDVFPTHAESAGRASDARRDAAAQLMAWSVTRLSADAFGPAMESTVSTICAEYRRRRATA